MSEQDSQTTKLLRLRVSAEADPGLVARLLGYFQNLNITPHRIVAEFATTGYWRRVRERPALLLISALLLFGPWVLAAVWAVRDPVAGAHERPSHPQPGRAGDHDARQLEHPVGGDELVKRRAVAGPDRQARDRAEQHALVDEQRRRPDPGCDPARERDDRHHALESA